MKKKIAFIMNPNSGTTSKAGIPGLIERRLDKEKFDYIIMNTQYAGHATELAGKAVEDNFDIVVAVGGDGTVNEVSTGSSGSVTRGTPPYHFTRL